MTYFQLKEANRYYWLINGQLMPECWSEDKIMSTYKTCANRIWQKLESHTHDIGFEAAWARRQITKKMKKYQL